MNYVLEKEKNAACVSKGTCAANWLYKLRFCFELGAREQPMEADAGWDVDVADSTATARGLKATYPNFELMTRR